MADSLIKKILLQADTPNVTPENLKELNTLLKSDTKGSWFLGSQLIGGFGSNYQSISSLLTFQDKNKELITAINEDALALQAKTLLEKGKKELKFAYRAGLCFALIAVYGSNATKKTNAYKQLQNLSATKGALPDVGLHDRCTAFLKPIPLDGTFFPLHQILWSWELLGKEQILSFETKRQKQISQPMTIENALYLLGLKAEGIDEKAIDDAHKMAKEKLKPLLDLKAHQFNKHELVKNLHQAQVQLHAFVQFKQFNSKKLLAPLDDMLKAQKGQPFTQRKIFDDLLKTFKEVGNAVTDAVKFASAHQYSSSLVTSAMVKARLGNDAYQFQLESELLEKASTYWDGIKTRADSLIKEANSHLQSSTALDSLNSMIERIESAIHVLTEIQGSEVTQSNVLLDVANKADDENNAANTNQALKEVLEKLQTRVSSYKDTMNSEVTSVAELSLSLEKAPIDVSTVVDAHNFILEKVALARKIDGKLAWLRGLDKDSKVEVEREFTQYVVSQVDLDTVVAAIVPEFTRISPAVLGKALKALLGTKGYQSSKPHDVTIREYLRSIKSGNLKEQALSFIGSLNELMQDQERISRDALKALPDPVSLRVDSATQMLNSGRAALEQAIRTVLANLNEELRKSIPEISKEYDELKNLIAKILQEKNNLDYSWQAQMPEFLQKQQALHAKLLTLNSKIPVDYAKCGYFSEDVVKLIDTIRKNGPTPAGLVAQMESLKTQLAKSSLDVLNFLALKARIKQEKTSYLAQGTHHKDRTESLERLALEIDRLHGVHDGKRFDKLVAFLQQEQAKTAESHQKIGFLGAYRSSRLEKMYASLSNEYGNFIKFSSDNAWNENTPRAWDKLTISSDALKYMRLKEHIQREIESYLNKGSHHQDRTASIQRLDQKITELDGENAKKEDRFASLLATLRTEEEATKASHMKVGSFFPSLHACELQKVYGRIRVEAEKFEAISIEQADAPSV